jgi:hypothetical protein
MASRENQGLHIALILLIMFSVLLCVISYVFYSKSESRRVTAEDAQNRLAQAQKDLQTANFKVQTLTYMINGGSKTLKQIKDDLANIPGGGDTNDATMAQLTKNFQDNMLLYGAPDQETESSRNYESLPTFLLARVRDLNQQLTDLRRTENELNAQKTQLEQTSAERSQKFEDAANQARQDLEAERTKFQTDLADVRKQMDGIAGQVTEKDNKIAELTDQMAKQDEASAKKASDMAKIIQDQKNRLKGYEEQSFETPDAVVTTVNQKMRTLYINVGAADNLRLQQTFSVFDKSTTSIKQAKPKGRIEVAQIIGDHVAECQILEDDVANIIVPGDLVLTPTWAPGQQIHFAIAGFVDLTGDGQNDVEMLKSLIAANGGVVDDAVTVQTRYLIQGAETGSADEGGMTNDERADFNAKVLAAGEIGVDRLSVNKLLSLMGWKADVKSVVLGSGAAEAKAGGKPAAGGAANPKVPADGAANPAGPEFRKRTPPTRGTNGAF